MALWILRGIFIVASAGVAFAVINSDAFQQSEIKWPWLVYLSMMFGAVGIVLADILVRKKRIETISCVYFGIVIGLSLTSIVGLSLEPFFFNPSVQASGIKNAVQFFENGFRFLQAVKDIVKQRHIYRVGQQAGAAIRLDRV